MKFTLSTVPAVTPELRTLSSTVQPAGNQSGAGAGARRGGVSAIDAALSGAGAGATGAASPLDFSAAKQAGAASSEDRRSCGGGGSAVVPSRATAMKVPDLRRGSGGNSGARVCSGLFGSCWIEFGSWPDVSAVDMFERERERYEFLLSRALLRRKMKSGNGLNFPSLLTFNCYGFKWLPLSWVYTVLSLEKLTLRFAWMRAFCRNNKNPMALLGRFFCFFGFCFFRI